MKKIVFQNDDTTDFEIAQTTDKKGVAFLIAETGEPLTARVYIFKNDEIPDLIKALKEMAGIE